MTACDSDNAVTAASAFCVNEQYRQKHREPAKLMLR